MALEKQAKKTKAKAFKALSQQLVKPRRNRVRINLWKLEKLGKKFKGKTLVVPGKVLGYGSLEEKINVAALEFSEKALKRLHELNVKPLQLKDLMAAEIKADDLVIVK